MRRTFWMAVTCATAIGIAAMVSGCGSGSANGDYTYNTSSAAKTARRASDRTGGDSDFGTWTFAGGNLTATLVNQSGGDVQFTVTAKATCAAPSSDFGFQLCTIVAGSSCAAGAVACPADATPTVGDKFFLKTVEGVALFALVDGKLHAGTVQGSCTTSIAGDYLFAHLGVSSPDLFGIYRLGTTLNTIVHADFGVRATTFPGSPAIPRETYYSTNDPNGSVTLPTTPTCSNGVWTVDPGPGNDKIYLTLTESGLFLMSQGSNGGQLSFKTTKAATIADLSGKTLQGISFPDDSDPAPVAVTFGTSTANDVPGTVKQGVISGSTLTVGSTGSATITKASAQSSAPFPLSQAPGNEAGAVSPNLYSDNALHTTYPTIGDIPGLFYIPPFDPADNGSVIVSIAKLNNKLVAFGVVNNARNPTFDPLQTMPNTGAFIAFEK